MSIFDLAAEDYKIPSPMNKIVLPYRQTKKGRAFTYAEERKLVDFCTQKQDNAASSALLVLLYFGLRQSELASIRVVDGKFLECETSKERLGQNVVLRKIPFTPMVKKVLPYIDFEKAKHTNVNTIYTTFKRLFPNHHTHELRYNFITRAKERVQKGNYEKNRIKAANSMDLSRRKHLGFLQQKNRQPITQTNKRRLDFCRFALIP